MLTDTMILGSKSRKVPVDAAEVASEASHVMFDEMAKSTENNREVKLKSEGIRCVNKICKKQGIIHTGKK